MMRTTDGGASWTNYASVGIAHGGGTIYYTSTGTLYASGNYHNLRSTNNGVTWTELASQAATAIFGDGKKLYTGRVDGGPLLASPESDGLTWTNFNSQQFRAGPFEMAIDSTNRILYSASWGAGIWALKLP
jgi:hypothetical protein